MARRKSVSIIREIGTDPRYNSETVQKFINVVMWRGKKNAARTIVYEAFEVLQEKMGTSEKAFEFFEKALENVIPAIEVRPRRVGGSVYQVPTEVNAHRARSLAMRWIINAASERKDKRMGIRIAHELIEASENRGNAVKKKLDVHKMAEANRAFAHYSW
jgi:small subunit ribosomal protein S7